jgi:hypothetical protein
MSGDGWWSDPEDDDEETAAIVRQAENRGMTPEERAERHRERAQGFSEVEDGETGDDLLKRLARSHTHLAVSTLVDVAENGTKDAARNTAARELLARGFGSVTRKSEQKVDVKITDQRAAHFQALRTLAERNPVLDIQDAEFQEIPTSRQIPQRRQNDDD